MDAFSFPFDRGVTVRRQVALEKAAEAWTVLSERRQSYFSADMAGNGQK